MTEIAAVPGPGRGRIAKERDDHASPDEITRAALALIDAEGIDKLTMRRLATELRLSPRAIYHHFAGKAELIDSVVRHIWDEAGRALLADSPADPTEWIVEVVLGARRTFVAHLEVAGYIATLPEPGDRLLASIDALTVAADYAGFEHTYEDLHLLAVFTLGSITLQATRRLVSAELGRDEAALRAWATEQFGTLDPPANRRAATMAALLPDADDRLFEAELRLLIAAIGRRDELTP
jgi:AcrR family transcriptional regulator